MVGLIIGFIAGFFGPMWVSDLITYLQNRKVIREITPLPVREDKLCKGPHSWMMAPVFNEKDPNKEVRLCQICGFMPDRQLMATVEAIDRIQENNRVYAMQNRIYKDFLAQENGDIQKYFDAELKNGVSFEKLVHVHGAGATFNARYNMYKSARAGEIAKELSRSDA